jgi:uncharacterized cupredoxin-like copper-binding protein
MSRVLLVALGAVALALLAACAGGETASRSAGVPLGEPQATVEVVMRDLAFEPARIEAAPGEVLELRLVNRGALVHDLTIDEAPVEFAVVESGGRAGGTRADLHFALDARRSMAVQVRVAEPGEYLFYCSVPGHRQSGMEGILSVR